MTGIHFKTEISNRHWQDFKSKRRAIYSLWFFVCCLFLSLGANFFANSKPILFSYNKNLYFPVIKYYHPSTFGQNSSAITDYRRLEVTSDGFFLWPPIKWDPLESNYNVASFPSPPSSHNWLGTDDRGRDVLTRLIYGFRYSISFAFITWCLSFLIGTLSGAYMGFLGGYTDLIGQRVMEVFESLPHLLILITLVSIFKASMSLLIFFSIFFGWMTIANFVRADFLRIKTLNFIEGAQAIGASRWRQIFIHILPNALVPIITLSPFTIAGGITTLAILDYLGFGLPAPTPSWGELLQQAQRNYSIAWWLAVFPSLAIFAVIISLNLIGESLRDAFSPKRN